MLAKSADIKEKMAVSIIRNVIGIVSSFRQRAEALDIREELITLVEKDLRVDIE